MNDRDENKASEPAEPKMPGETIQLYKDFTNGEISRRAFMAGVKKAGGLAAPSTGSEIQRSEEKRNCSVLK